MDEGLWEGIDACLTDILGVPAMCEYWEIRGHWFSNEFRQYVAKRIEIAAGKEFYPTDQPS